MRAGLQRKPATADGDDHRLASEVLTIAEDFGPLRRALVRRRCRRVFGDYWTELAEDFPYDGGSFESALTPLLFGSAWRERAGKPALSSTGGIMHRAYVASSGDGLQARLHRELRLLRRAL